MLEIQNKKNLSPDHKIDIHDTPVEADPTYTLFNGLFLKQMRRYKVQIFNKVTLAVP